MPFIQIYSYKIEKQKLNAPQPDNETQKNCIVIWEEERLDHEDESRGRKEVQVCEGVDPGETLQLHSWAMKKYYFVLISPI